MENNFQIDRSQDSGKEPVFMIGMEEMFMDYEFTYEELIELRKAITDAIEAEMVRMNKEKSC